MTDISLANRARDGRILQSLGQSEHTSYAECFSLVGWLFCDAAW